MGSITADSVCKRASDFEEHFGAGSLLDLYHPSVVILIENVISPKELLAFRGRQEAIAMNPVVGQLD